MPKSFLVPRTLACLFGTFPLLLLVSLDGTGVLSRYPSRLEQQFLAAGTAAFLILLAACLLMLKGRAWGRLLVTFGTAGWLPLAAGELVFLSRYFDSERITLAWIVAFWIPAALLGTELAFTRTYSKASRVALAASCGVGIVLSVLFLPPQPHFKHPSRIQALSFSPDGRLLAASDYGGVSLWDPTRGTLILRVALPADSDLAFVKGGSELAVAEDDTVHFVNLSGSIRHRLRFPALKSIVGLTAYDGGNRLAVAGYRGWALYDVQRDLVLIERPDTHPESSGLLLSVSHDGTRIAVAGRGHGDLELINLRGSATTWRKTLNDRVAAVAFAANDERLLVALQDGSSGYILEGGSIRRTGPPSSAFLYLDPATGEPMPGAPHHTGIVHAARYSPDGSFLGWADTDGVGVADARTGKILFVSKFPELWYRSHYGGSGEVLDFSPASNLVASGGTLKRIALWDTTTGREIGPGELR